MSSKAQTSARLAGAVREIEPHLDAILDKLLRMSDHFSKVVSGKEHTS
jgi:hypothetical protein